MGMSRFAALPDEKLLAVCLYGESRGESREGKIAVASVIKTRVEKGDWYGEGYHGVILKPKQFSCFNTSDPNFPKIFDIAGDFDSHSQKSQTLAECYEIARGIISGDIKPSVCATHYKTLSCKASWADKMHKIATCGAHEFYV